MPPNPPWIRPPREDAALRLFCLPYAGGGSADFRQWRELLPPSIDVVPTIYPARERLFSQPPTRRMGPLVEQLADALFPHTHRPYALHGHSMGAWVAFELARTLRRRGAPPPVHLVVCARRAPHLPSEDTPLWSLPQDALLGGLERRYGAMGAEVRADPELLRLFLPMLRADLEVLDTHVHTSDAPLDTPITAFGGTDDHAVPEHELRAWSVHTTAGFQFEAIPGGHFFHRGPNAAFVARIAQLLGG
jgi:surfactin synthase thioesterase subunit